MKVYSEELILATHSYKMELHFPGLSWLRGQIVKVKILWNLDAMSIGANWTTGGADTWYLFYHLKASGVSITHGKVFNEAIKTAYDDVIWIEAVDLGEEEPLFTPDIPLPQWLKDWKWLGVIVIVILAFLVALSMGYKRRKRKAA